MTTLTHALISPRASALAAASISVVMVVVHDARLSLALLPLVGLLLVIAVSRWLSDDDWLPRLGSLNLLLGVSVALGLYWLSGLDHPRLEPMVVKQGFWTFGLDAIYYHERAQQIAHALRHHVLFPDMDLVYAGGFMALLGLIYAGLGAHPLIGSFTNVVLLALSVLLVYRVTMQLGTRWAARAAAGATAVWPSALLWSSQVMKDTACLFLFLLMIVLTVAFLGDVRNRWPARASLGLGLFAASLLLSTLRPYLVVAVLATTIAALILTTLRSRQLYPSHAVVVGIVGLSVAAARLLGPNFLLLALNPTHSPPAILYRQAKALEVAGRLEESRDTYRASVASKADFWPAYRRLGELSIRLGDLPAAEAAFRKYLDVYPLDDSAPVIRQVVHVLADANGTAVVDRLVAGPVARATGELQRKSVQPRAARVPIDRRPGGGPGAPIDGDPGDGLPRIERRGDRPPNGRVVPGGGFHGDNESVARGSTPRRNVADEVSQMLAHHDCTSYDCGRVTLADTTSLLGRLSGEARRPLPMPTPATMARLRNGFISAGGSSLYTTEMMGPDGSWLQWLRWSPQAFLTALGAPYPWQWSQGGRIDPTRVGMGIESLLLLLLLPFALIASWRIVRTWRVERSIVVVFFFMFTTILGLTVVNVGTLVRLRLPAIFIGLTLGAIGLASARWANSSRHDGMSALERDVERPQMTAARLS